MPIYKDDQCQYIELIISWDFIQKYNLLSLVDNSRVLLSKEQIKAERLAFPFIPVYNYKEPEIYLNRFLEEIRKILPQNINNLDYHLDNLLFISTSFFIEADILSSKQYYNNYLIEEGKFLLQMIKTPFSEITESNIYEYVENEDELLAYLQVLTKGKDDKRFLKGEKINFSKISNSLWKKLNIRLHQDKNINVALTSYKKLVVSKDLLLQFHDRKTKKSFKPIRPKSGLQNEHMVQIIIESLIKKQEKARTAFYDALLDHEFITGNSNGLDKSLVINTKSFYTSNLYTLYNKLKHYIIEENIFPADRKLSVNHRINECIYKCFSLLGFLLKDKKPATNRTYEELQASINTYKKKTGAKTSFATEYFHRTFKKEINYKPVY